VQLHVKPGSVHALIGENGAGKSTLMKCLFGIYKPDEGDILLEGRPLKIKSPKEALEAGISMIHQELNPIPDRNIKDNIWLGRFEKKFKIIVDEQAVSRKTKKLFENLEFDIRPEALAKELSVSELQALEIAKAISYQAKIIIMDEPTSSLTNTETAHLFKLIRRIKKNGTSIIYISHKMEEILEIADEATIMRDGQYIGTWNVEELTIDTIIQKMVGRTLDNRFPPQLVPVQKEIILSVKDYTSVNEHSFKNISFDLYKGEILGIGGLVGAQRTELVEAVFGLRKTVAGKLYKNGRKIENHTPTAAIANGFALLTEERRVTGIVSMLSVKDNMLIASRKNYTCTPLHIYSEPKSEAAAKKASSDLNVKTPSLKTKIADLSGGNQQKVLLGRWLLTNSNILILDEPTRGIDVAAKYEIYKIMRDLAAEGNAIIMVSSEMPELLGISDRILVMCNGNMTGIIEKEEATQVEIMRLATQYSS